MDIEPSQQNLLGFEQKRRRGARLIKALPPNLHDVGGGDVGADC